MLLFCKKQSWKLEWITTDKKSDWYQINVNNAVLGSFLKLPVMAIITTYTKVNVYITQRAAHNHHFPVSTKVCVLSLWKWIFSKQGMLIQNVFQCSLSFKHGIQEFIVWVDNGFTSISIKMQSENVYFCATNAYTIIHKKAFDFIIKLSHIKLSKNTLVFANMIIHSWSHTHYFRTNVNTVLQPYIAECIEAYTLIHWHPDEYAFLWWLCKNEDDATDVKWANTASSSNYSRLRHCHFARETALISCDLYIHIGLQFY